MSRRRAVEAHKALTAAIPTLPVPLRRAAAELACRIEAYIASVASVPPSASPTDLLAVAKLTEQERRDWLRRHGRPARVGDLIARRPCC